MARLTFPSDRLVYTASTYAGSAFTSAANAVATVYSDSAGTTLADVQNFDGSPNAAATFTVDTTSRLPLFLGPAAGTDSLYVKVGAGPVTAIYAVTSGDISAAVGIEVTNRTAADAAHVATSNPHSVTPQMIGAPTVVVHGATAGTTRPAGATFVHWIGSVAPTNVTGNDEWTDTANKILKRWNGSSFDSLGNAASLAVKDEGTTVLPTPSALNFVGAGVTASDGGGGIATVTIPAGGLTLTDRGNWATTTAYAVGDTVTQNSHRYICATAHTSGTFATDLAAGKWVLQGDTGALIAVNNLSDVGAAATARTNLGLGTAATVNTGTTSGTIPLLSTGGVLPIARLATGTPDGTKFVRDDGTLVAPASSVPPYTASPATLLTNKNMVLPIATSNPNMSNIGQTNGLLQLLPLPVSTACTVTALTVNIAGTAGSAGSVIRLGIYNPDKTLLVDAGTVAGTSLATVTQTLSQAISTPGMYYVAVVAQGAPATNPSMRAFVTTGLTQIVAVDSQTGNFGGSFATVVGYSQSGVTGALPTPCVPTAAVTSATGASIVTVTF